MTGVRRAFPAAIAASSDGGLGFSFPVVIVSGVK